MVESESGARSDGVYSDEEISEQLRKVDAMRDEVMSAERAYAQAGKRLRSKRLKLSANQRSVNRIAAIRLAAGMQHVVAERLLTMGNGFSGQRAQRLVSQMSREVLEQWVTDVNDRGGWRALSQRIVELFWDSDGLGAKAQSVLDEYDRVGEEKHDGVAPVGATEDAEVAAGETQSLQDQDFGEKEDPPWPESDCPRDVYEAVERLNTGGMPQLVRGGLEMLDLMQTLEDDGRNSVRAKYSRVAAWYQEMRESGPLQGNWRQDFRRCREEQKIDY